MCYAFLTIIALKMLDLHKLNGLGAISFHAEILIQQKITERPRLYPL